MSAVRLERQHSLPQGQPVFHTARGSMYPRLARLSPCAAVPHKGSAPRNIASAPRPLHAA